MEFLNGLEKAIGLGLTKEEFIRLWKAESKMNVTGEAMSESTSRASENQQQVRDQLKQELDLQLQVLFNQYREKQEQYWQQIQKKISQLVEDVHHQFGILCQHVSNTAECQESSLKLNIIQEFELLKQDLKKRIENQYTKYADEPASLGMSVEQSKVASLQNNRTEQTISRFDDLTVDFADGVKMSEHEITTEFHKYDESQDDELVECENLCDSDYDWYMEENLLVDGSERNYENGFKSVQDVHNVQSHEKDISRSIQMKTTCIDNSSGFKHGIDSSLYPATSLDSVSEEKESVEATGFYADTISNQMRQTSSRESSLSTIDGSVIYRSKIVNPSNADDRYYWNSFTITNSKNFSSSREIHLSPFLHTKTWKAQLHVTFNAKQQLTVRVHVSRTNHNSDMWPLKFTGYGYIYHLSSKRFTQVWQLPSVTCQKPSPTGEVGFPTQVCLSTNRGSYPEITYKELEFRHYAENDRLVIKWNLKAKKIIPGTKSKS